jgi:signal transduction histidine kinase
MIPAPTEPLVVDALYRISSLVSDTDDPREALEIIMDEVIRILPTQSAAIEIINPDTGRLEIEVFRGFPDSSREMQLRLGQGVTGWVALHGRPLVVPDVTKDPRYISVKPEIRSEMAVPMIGERGAVVGVVNVDSEQVNAFDENHLKVLTLLTNEASRVVNRIWLINKLKEKADQLEALIKTGQSIVQKRELGDLLKSIVSEAREIMECRVCALYFLEGQPECLSLKAVSGTQTVAEVDEEITLTESAVGTVVHRRKMIEVFDLRRTEENHFLEWIQREDLVSMLACPVLYEDTVIGVLICYTDHPHRFDNEERRIFQTIASLGAAAIQNARLYARIFQTEENLRRNERLTTLGLLSAEIAHEIRNPLTVIRLLFESLQLDFPPGDMRKKDVAIIGEKLDQLEGIVSRVLSFGKSQENMRSRYDLRTIVEDTLLLVRMKLQQNRIHLQYQGRPRERLLVEVSKGQIQQALLNLIINATEAMPKGGSIRISLKTDRHEQQPVAVVEIGDSGPGIPEDIRDNIFESFLSGKAEGTGLGLAIVKRILKSHNGDIAVTSSGTKGTVMAFWVPLCQ